ncbi:MAG TPA: PDZ domain-containing protein [Pyrinomonadaceae bacterium]|nr:PDZ domain-containing protein [Pyrinomonadaceae bacterium]
MKPRNLITLSAILLFSSLSALAQVTPSAPSTPPAPAAPEAPMAFSFSFDGGNYLGVVPEEINRENMSRYGLNTVRGVGISRVAEGSPADKAGLKKGDVIVGFDGEPVTSTRKLFRLIGEAAPEQSVRLTVLRNGSEQQLTATLGERESGARAFRALTPAPRGDFRLAVPPAAPRVWGNGDAPEVFSYGFGNNRRVGITSTTLTRQLADYFGVSAGKGLLVTSVSENSPASKAGLRAGDVITEVNGEKIDGTGDFVRALNRKDDGEVTITIIRDRSQHTIKVTPERRPNPTFNLSDVAPTAITQIPPFSMEMPEVRIPVMPRIDIPIMPKMQLLTLPQLKKNLERIERLQTLPGII